MLPIFLRPIQTKTSSRRTPNPIDPINSDVIETKIERSERRSKNWLLAVSKKYETEIDARCTITRNNEMTMTENDENDDKTDGLKMVAPEELGSRSSDDAWLLPVQFYRYNCI